MATKKVWLGVGDSVGLGETSPISIPVQSLLLGQTMTFRKSTEIPLGYTAISAITLRYRRTGTGNLYLKFATSHIASATASTPTEDADSYTVYAAGTADNKIANITVSASAYSALTGMSAGDILNVGVWRDDSIATDTYTTDFDVVGFLVEFTVASASGGAVSPATNAIITLDEVKDYLKILLTSSEEDDFLQLTINNQSSWVESQIQNKVVSQLISNELSHSTGRSRIRTKYFPIVSLTLLQYLNSSLVWTDFLTTLTDAVLHNPENQFSHENNSFHIELAYEDYSTANIFSNIDYPEMVQNVKISYYAGYATIPTEIHDVCMERVVNYYKQSARGDGRFGLESQSNNGMGVNGSTRFVDFVPRHKEMLKPYKRRYE